MIILTFEMSRVLEFRGVSVFGSVYDVWHIRVFKMNMLFIRVNQFFYVESTKKIRRKRRVAYFLKRGCFPS